MDDLEKLDSEFSETANLGNRRSFNIRCLLKFAVEKTIERQRHGERSCD